MIFIQKMSITMGNFRTKVNFSNQIKEYTNTEGTFSGSVYINQYTILGTDYSNLPLGLDNSTTGVTYFVSPIITDTFTGTTGSTTFYFSDSNMYLGVPYLSAITPSNTGITQNIFVTQPTYSTTVDGNNFDVYFSGVSYDLTATDIVEYSSGLYSGSLVTDFLLYVSGTTYPWWFLKSGSTTWNEIKGRTKTDRLTITNSASTGYVLTCMDNEGNAAWQSFSSITGFTSGDCISDFYVSNIHSCSPLNINPLDEGNVYFGSTSGVTVDVLNKRIGLNTNSPQYTFDFYSKDSNTRFYYLDTTPTAQSIYLSGGSTIMPQLGVASRLSSPNITIGFTMGIIGQNNTLYPSYGSPLDSFIYAGADANVLNIINAPKSSVPSNSDHIRFYAGQFVNSGNGPDIHIQGSGVTRGYVGIGTNSPTSTLQIGDNIKPSTFRYVQSGTTSLGYVLTSSDSQGNAIWKQPIGLNSGNCVSDFYVSNLHGCSPITVWDQFQHTTCSATGQSSNSFGNFTYSYGDYSNSEGYNNYAIGDYSHVEGNYSYRDANRAIGNGSHAEGTETTSNGLASHAEGDGSTANGDGSHSEGLGTTSDGGGSHAEGDNTNSIGIASHTEGQLTITNGAYSHAEGYQSITYGLHSHAEGNQTKTYAPYSHAEGQLNISGLVYLYTEYISGVTGYFYIDTIYGDVTSYFQNGDDLFISDINSNKNFLVSTYQYTVDGVSYQEISPSISGTVISVSPDPGFPDDLGTNLFIGNLTTPLVSTISNSEIFDASHTEGSNNISFGLNSHAEGYYTISYGEASHSQGRSTKSIGDYSFASGLNTYADGNQTFIHSTNSHIKSSNFTSILGGNSNTIEDSSTNSGIFSGRDSTINSSLHSSIIGGSENTLINSFNSVIIGGDSNIINNLTNTVILGSSNKIASNSDTVYVPDLVITPITVPTTSGDTVGEVGSISWDDTYFYIKTNSGWGRINLDYGF